MTDHDLERRAELIAAAATHSLTGAEADELEQLRRVDPEIDRDVAQLSATLSSLGGVGEWDSSAPPPGLRERVLALDNAPVLRIQPPVAPERRRGWVVALAAAACLLVGAGGALAIEAVTSVQQEGQPGQLGALERVDFVGEPEGVVVAGALVAHTWGTETVLTIDGLPAGDSYEVVLIGRDGERTSSGTFLGSTVTVDCRMNGAILRPEVTGVAIESVDGEVVAAAALPDVG